MFSKRYYSTYECAINCERMIKMLVRCYNVMLKKNHYPPRLLNVLDAIIKKVKGNAINKISILHVIKEDLTFLMKIFLGIRIEENYENDKKISKHNYGSRESSSIESVSLENRLVLCLSKITEEQIACTMSDLEACYDTYEVCFKNK